MDFKTADLCDDFAQWIDIVAPIFQDYGGIKTFGGPIATVQVYEDNVLVRQMLEQPGQGQVLVIDGGGSLNCALMGDNMAQLASDNGWAGVVVNGCIRDSVDFGQIAIGAKALNTLPKKSNKEGKGECNVAVTFGGVTFQPGQFLYADADGIIVASQSLIASL